MARFCYANTIIKCEIYSRIYLSIKNFPGCGQLTKYIYIIYHLYHCYLQIIIIVVIPAVNLIVIFYLNCDNAIAGIFLKVQIIFINF